MRCPTHPAQAAPSGGLPDTAAYVRKQTATHEELNASFFDATGVGGPDMPRLRGRPAKGRFAPTFSSTQFSLAATTSVILTQSRMSCRNLTRGPGLAAAADAGAGRWRWRFYTSQEPGAQAGTQYRTYPTPSADANSSTPPNPASQLPTPAASRLINSRPHSSDLSAGQQKSRPGLGRLSRQVAPRRGHNRAPPLPPPSPPAHWHIRPPHPPSQPSLLCSFIVLIGRRLAVPLPKRLHRRQHARALGRGPRSRTPRRRRSGRRRRPLARRCRAAAAAAGGGAVGAAGSCLLGLRQGALYGILDSRHGGLLSCGDALHLHLGIGIWRGRTVWWNGALCGDTVGWRGNRERGDGEAGRSWGFTAYQGSCVWMICDMTVGAGIWWR
ncbi:hypothetical protein PLESTF_000148100 [Pleodorina starrii]|nr:hypothetical protein PLESTF_000148100 [Pleodorina starrii]